MTTKKDQKRGASSQKKRPAPRPKLRLVYSRPNEEPVEGSPEAIDEALRHAEERDESRKPPRGEKG